MTRVESVPSSEERAFLESLVQDGWPLVLLANGLDGQEFERLQAMALSLTRQGLAGIYGRPEDARYLSLGEAEAVILDRTCWTPFTGNPTWMICATEAGNALIGAPNEW